MKINWKGRFMVGLFILLLAGSVLAQSPSSSRSEPKLARKLGIVIGAVGGFALAGSILDDDRNSTGELWSGIILLPLGGGVAGYFVGRAIDRRNTPLVPVSTSVHQETLARIVATESARLQRVLERGGKGRGGKSQKKNPGKRDTSFSIQNRTLNLVYSLDLE